MTSRLKTIRPILCGLVGAALVAVALVWPSVALADAGAKPIPAHPEKLTFDELDFEVPDGSEYRHELSNGVVVYVAEDRALPLVDISMSLRVGRFLEPADKVGLVSLTASMLRQGGTATMTAEDFDEKVEFLAANISSGAGDTQAFASLNTISPVLDDALGLFFDMLHAPGFQADRLEIEKDSRLEQMKQRNDDASDIQRRQWGWLMYGEDFYAERHSTKAHIVGITREDLIDFHAKYWRPENMILSVAGDVDAKAILEKLEAELGRFDGSGPDVPWPPPQPTHEPAPGVYHVEKDIPQGKVLIGQRTKQWNDWDDPDLPPMRVMNFILGGSGFTSRITQRVRSDEGLAYSAGSRVSFDPMMPANFSIFYQSKNSTVALAAKIGLEEVKKIQSEPVTDGELQTAITSLVETFPRRFESAQQIASTFAFDEYIGRPHSYWETWRSRMEKVGKADIQNVAKKYLDPGAMTFLIVGPWEEVAPGDADDRANMGDFFGGEVTHLPLRDPMTLEPMK